MSSAPSPTSPATPPSLLSIGQLAREVGATPSALRYWERAGLLTPVQRVNGQRRYSPDAALRVGTIRLFEDAGFGIREIRELLALDPEGRELWRSRGRAKLAEVRARIARLEASAEFLEHGLSCPHPSVTACPTFNELVRWRAQGGNGPPPEKPAALASAEA
jgi:MerR family transcriptional regulator, copper efflux regulator